MTQKTTPEQRATWGARTHHRKGLEYLVQALLSLEEARVRLDKAVSFSRRAQDNPEMGRILSEAEDAVTKICDAQKLLFGGHAEDGPEDG